MAQDRLDDVATAAIARKGAGRSVDGSVRGPVEARLGAALGHAHVHDDANAQQAAQAMGARAFAHGSDVLLGAGESERDPAIMAHELTHVAQQTASGRAAPQRKVTVGPMDSPAEAEADAIAAAATSGAPPQGSALLCDHHAAPGQMLVGDFLARLEPRVVAIANAELGALGSAAGCPYIVQAFAKYRAQPATATLAVLQRWIPAARAATSVDQLEELALARVQQGVAQWCERGTLPADLAAAEPALATQAAAPAGAGGGVQRMTLEGLEGELGTGARVDGRVADQVSRATGRDVSGARVHTGPVAARKAAEVGATAFAVGDNVVMGGDAPAAGTAIGDALLTHELAHTAQQRDAVVDPRARKRPIGAEDHAAEHDADRATVKAAGKSNGFAEVMRTGLQLQRCADGAGKPARQMDNARYQQIEQRLAALIAEKRALVENTGTRTKHEIDAEIDKLVEELRVDFGVRIDRGKILDAAVTTQDMRVVDGRIAVSPSGGEHYFGERMGFTAEIDHVPPGQTLQIGWRWRTPGSANLYRFLSPGPESLEKSKTEAFELPTAFWALPPDAIVQAQGMEVVAQIYIGDHVTPLKAFSTGFIPLPAKPVPELKVINAPARVVKGAALALQIGPFTPDHHSYSLDWFVDDKLAQAAAPNFHHTYDTEGVHTVHADLFRVRRNLGIREKTFEKRTQPATFEVMTQDAYGKQALADLDRSPFKPAPVALGRVVSSGEKSLQAIQHRIDQGGPQAAYWQDRMTAEKERLAKLKELAPDHATSKPLPADPTKLESGASYTGPITAMLVMSAGGGGAQPLAMHLTAREAGGTYEVRLIDATSKKVLKFDGSGSSALAAYASAFEAWRTSNEYPTGGRVVHKFAPSGWTQGDGFSTTTSWKTAKEWVDGILQVGGMIVGALLLANPEPVITKWLGAVLIAAVVARSSVAIYERIRNGGGVVSSENVLDAVAIVTSFMGVTGGALRSAGLKGAVSPTSYRVGNWLIMGAIAADGGTFVYASSEASAALRVVQADPTLDDGTRAGEMLRIMSSLFLTGAMLIASNRDLIRNGLKPHDFVKSDLEPGMKPELDAGARLDAEYELKQAGQWTKETSKLDHGALLDKLFTNRSRQELETALAKKIGGKQAQAFADAIGNDGFVALHASIGEETVANLAREVSAAKMKDLHLAIGHEACGKLVIDVGIAGVKHLADHLTSVEIKALSEGFGGAALGRVLASPGKAGVELARLAKLTPAELGRLSSLHTQHLGNLAALPAADLAVIAKLDPASIDQVSRIPGDSLKQMSPLTEAKLKTKLADVAAVDADMVAQFGDPKFQHHLRETNFFDRGGIAQTGGEVKVMVTSKSGKLAPVPVKSAEYIRLEPIPSPPAPTPVTISSVEVKGVHKDTGKPLTGDVQPQPDGQLPVPKPGQPDIDVTVKTSAGTFPYTEVEKPPPGTRIAVKSKELAAKGVSGGHTRAAWNAAEDTYGDVINKTGDQKIAFNLPSSKDPIDLAAISYEIKVTKTTGGTTTTTNQPARDPKTIFKHPADLDRFESHTRPYMSAKLESLRSRIPPPKVGEIIAVDVPVTTAAGVDATIRVEFPYRTDNSGRVSLHTWWVGQSAFAKGSPFNP
jgi:hypothetical protein